MILETERLYLREMNQGDFDALCRMQKDPGVMYAYEGAFSGGEARAWLDRQIRRDPFEGIGKPEPLKHDLTGLWSRRINETDRVTYKVLDDMIVILACKGHYD